MRYLQIVSVLLLSTLTFGCTANAPRVEVNDVSAAPAKIYPTIPPTTQIKDLHYPNFKTLHEAVEDSEKRLNMGHYRRALQKADPNEQYPDRAGAVRAFARPANKDGSLDRGVIVDVDLWSVEALKSLDAT